MQVREGAGFVMCGPSGPFEVPPPGHPNPETKNLVLRRLGNAMQSSLPESFSSASQSTFAVHAAPACIATPVSDKIGLLPNSDI